MQKWKIIKGKESDFINCPDWVKVVFREEGRSNFRGFVSSWVKGALLSYGTDGNGPDEGEYPRDKLNGYFDVGIPIAERLPVEDVMAIPRGWLVNAKFTEDDSYAKWATEHGYEVIAIHEPLPVPSIVDVILETSVQVPARPVRQVYKKLTEEIGEVGDALLAIAEGADPDELLEGEIADVIICAVDLLYVHLKKTSRVVSEEMTLNMVKGLLEDRVKAKTAKWKSIVLDGDHYV